jgi:hypothetical protein
MPKPVNRSHFIAKGTKLRAGRTNKVGQDRNELSK